jgi:hypothetical protein
MGMTFNPQAHLWRHGRLRMLFHAFLKPVSHGTEPRLLLRKAQIAGDFCHGEKYCEK